MLLSLFLSGWLVASSMAMERPYYHAEKAEEYFEEFIVAHGKSYHSIVEKQTRFEIFKENLKRINNLNTFSGSVHGVTQFTDLTSKEFSDQYNSCVGPPTVGFGQSSCKVITDADLSTNQAPQSLDYRTLNAVTPVKNQQGCNCCWAFASVGSLEAQYALKYRQLLSLSEQELMDCLPSSGHCGQGSFMTSAFSDLMLMAGVESESDYPYVARDLQCRLEAPKAKVRVAGCYNFQLRNEDKLREALFKYGPIAIAVNIIPVPTHTTGIIDARLCPAGRPGHAVLLVGYGTDSYGRDYWIIKNSYGTNFGEQGYLRFARGQNVCGMMNSYAASGTIL